MLDAALFVRAARALYGDEWVRATADLLAADERTLRRIKAAVRDGTPDAQRVNPRWSAPLAAALFYRAGRTLSGEEWVRATADLLAADERTLRRIKAAVRDGTPDAQRVNPRWSAPLAAALRQRAVDAQDEAREAEAVRALLEG